MVYLKRPSIKPHRVALVVTGRAEDEMGGGWGRVMLTGLSEAPRQCGVAFVCRWNRADRARGGGGACTHSESIYAVPTVEQAKGGGGRGKYYFALLLS